MYRLYGDSGTAAFAPHALLVENDIPFEWIAVDRKTDEIRSELFLSMSPGGYVPVMVLPDGRPVYEAAAICLYLGQCHKLTDVCPDANDDDLPIFLRSLFYLTNTVQEACKLFYYPDRYAPESAPVNAVRDRARALLSARWRVVEGHLSANGPFHLGERYSIADIYMTMLADWHPERDDLLTACPAISTCFEAVTARPALADVLRLHQIIE